MVQQYSTYRYAVAHLAVVYPQPHRSASCSYKPVPYETVKPGKGATADQRKNDTPWIVMVRESMQKLPKAAVDCHERSGDLQLTN
jgi:hypothetical protein